MGEAQVQTSIGTPLCSLVRAYEAPHDLRSGLVPVALCGVSACTGGGPESPCLFVALVASEEMPFCSRIQVLFA